jgi:serine/threonine protein kinase
MMLCGSSSIIVEEGDPPQKVLDYERRYIYILTGQLALVFQYMGVVVSPEALNLVESLLHVDFDQRPSINEIRQHPWMQMYIPE